MVKRILTVILMLSVSLAISVFAPAGTASAAGDAVSQAAKYRDIENHAGKSAIEKWSDYGIISGSADGYFWPDGKITRADMAASLVQLVGYTSKSAQKPHDVGESDWYYGAIMKLIAANVMNCAGGYARPYDPVTREEAVVMIARVFKVSERLDGRTAFADWNDIDSWAKGYVLNMRSAGYLDHFGEYLNPQKNVTRAEYVMIIDAMFDAYYSQPGEYTGTINGNVIIRSAGVAFRGAHVKGDVYVVEGVGDGYYTFDESTVIDGKVIAWAGKANPFPYIDPYKPMVALTFDDGPTGTTVSILDTLEAYGARATFFVVGSRIAANAGTLRRAADIGCELASHTWSHTSLTAMSRDRLIQDTEWVNNALFDVTGVMPVLLRPPNGAFSAATTATLGTIGISTVYWSVDPQDWSHRNANTTYTRVMNSTRDGSIVLMHDLVTSTATAVEWLVPELLAKGFQLVTVSELLAYSDIGVQPGKLYFNKFSYR